MQIQWLNSVRVHVGCGGEVEVLPEGYVCTGCGDQSFSDIPGEEEQEREDQEDEGARERERVEYREFERNEWEQSHK